jgi:hypothetical protein
MQQWEYRSGTLLKKSVQRGESRDMQILGKTD